MITIFIDDSGTDPNQKVVVAGALIVRGRRLNSLVSEWKKFDDSYKFGDFHSSVCAARGKRSIFETWSDRKVRNAFRRLRRIMKAHGENAISLAIDKDDLKEVFPEEWLKIGGSEPFTWAFRSLLNLVRNWNSLQAYKEPLEYVIDWIEPHEDKRREIDMLFAQFEDVYPGEYAGKYAFRKRELVPGLQCVDHVAWASYAKGRNAYYHQSVKEMAECAFRDMEKKRWLHALGHTREQWKATIRQDLMDTEGEKRRHAWYENYMKVNPDPRRRTKQKSTK